MKNVRKSGDVTELSDITKLESDKYGLSPGSYGTLQFTVVPTDKTTTLDLEFKTLVAAYVAEYDEYGLLEPVNPLNTTGWFFSMKPQLPSVRIRSLSSPRFS